MNTENIKNRETARFNYTGNIVIKEDKKRNFGGHINLLTNADIEVRYNPDQDNSSIEHIVENPTEAGFTAVLRHELNHKGGGRFLGCPRNIDLHLEEIIEPTTQVMEEKNIPNTIVGSGQTIQQYFANIVEDIIDNAELGNKCDFGGIWVCYKDSAMKAKDEQFPALFDAFIRLQEKLYGGSRSNKLMQNHHSDDEKVEIAVDNVMKRTGMEYMQRAITTKRGEIRKVFNRKAALNYLCNPTNWKNFTKIVVEEFIELIDTDQLSDDQYIEEIFLPLTGEGDTFSDEMDDLETKMRMSYKKFKAGEEAGEGFQPPSYLEKFESLDLVYRRLARTLDIKTNSKTRTSAYPVMRYGKREFDVKHDPISKARVRYRNGGLELYTQKYTVDYPVQSTSRVRSIPKIKFIMLDTSSSMQISVTGEEGVVMNPWAELGMQWTNTSRYHHALLGWYGVLEHLRRNGGLKHTSVQLANYSYSTQIATNLRDAKRLALSPQFGGTSLSMDQIRGMFGKNELVGSFADGEIMNWDSIKDEYIQRAKQNHYFHVQIGGHSRMAYDLEEAGLEVVYDNGLKLGKIVVDLTKKNMLKRKKK